MKWFPQRTLGGVSYWLALLLLGLGLTSLSASANTPLRFVLQGSGELSQVWLATADKNAWEPADAERAWQSGLFQPAELQPALIETLDRGVWLRFNLRNPTARALGYILAPHGFYDDHLLLHFRDPARAGSWATLQTGENVRFPEKNVPVREPVFEFSLGPGEERTFYLQLEGLISVQTAFKLVSPASRYWVQRRSVDRLTGFHLGVTGALFLYNLFIFLSLRRKDFLWYLCYLVTFWVGFFIYQNLHLSFVPWLISPWHSYATVIAMVLTGYFLTMFSLRFLNPQDFAPRIARAIRFVRGLWIALFAALLVPVLFLLVLGTKTSWVHPIGDALFTITALLILIVTLALPPMALHLWRCGCQQARFFGWAFCCFFIGLLPALFAQLGWRLRSSDDLVWMQFGTMFEMLLLAFALADKVSLLQNERNAAQAAAVREATQRARLEITNEEIRRQSARIEEQAQRIQLANVELELSNQALKTLSQEKSEFLGIAAHDLKNPLSAICALAKLLRTAERDDKDHLSAQEKLDLLENIVDSAEQMLGTIEALLSTDRLESGKVQVEPQICHFGDLIRSVIRLNLNHANHKSITIEADSFAGLAAYTDLQSLREIFDNLLSNAIKYTPPGGSVWLKQRDLESPAGFFRVEISDTGPGFSQEDREHLFERFTKLSARPTGGENSTGLGLSIVHKLCQLNGIEISLASPPGRGATFILDVPAWQNPSPDHDAQPAAGEMTTESSLTN